MYSEKNYYQALLSSRWPEWKITRRLGKGSFGSVYEIQRNDLGNEYKCALKILHMEMDVPADTRRVYAGLKKDPDGSLSRDETFDAGVVDYTKPLFSEGSSGEKTMKAGMVGFKAPDGSDSEMNLAAPFTLEPEEELEDFVRSVSNEIDMMMQLKGVANIVNIEDYTVFREPGSRTIMIRMELLESVDQYVKRCGALERDEVIRLGVEICAALERCEGKNIVHRDIKTSNIFFGEHVGFKLGDFGISRTMSSIYSQMSMTGVGTIQYMAPEIYWGKKYDHTVDIYSLGVVLYTLLNHNKPPFYDFEQSGHGSLDERSRIHEANMRRLGGEPLPLPANAEDDLGQVICRACDPDPLKRFRSASLFREALTSAQRGDGSPIFPSGDGTSSSDGEEETPFDWKKLIAPLAIVAVLLCAVLYFAVSARSGGGAPAAVSYKISYMDADGNVLTEKTGQGEPGDKIEIEEIDFEGYKLKDLPSSVTLSSREEDNEIIVRYEKEDDDPSLVDASDEIDDPSRENASDEIDDPSREDASDEISYSVLATDLDGVVLERQTKKGRIGETITESPFSIEGYTCISEGESIKLSETASENIIVFVYQENSYSYTVLCVDGDTGEQLNTNTYDGERDQSITVYPPQVEGYYTEDEEVTISLSDDEPNQTVRLTYYTTAEDMDIPSDNVLHYNGHSYYVMRSKNIYSFQEAQEYCESRGGYLAIINDDSENSALYDFVFYDLDYKSAYFGYTDEFSERDWYWVDGSSGGYENWLNGQPDNLNGREDYALFYYVDTPYKWNDGDFGPDPEGYVYFLIEWDA